MELELSVTSPLRVRETAYRMTGSVRRGGQPEPALADGGSVRIRAFTTGLTEEVFLDAGGDFAQDLELAAGADNPFEVAVCDGAGREVACVTVRVRHDPGGGDASPPAPERATAFDPPWPEFAGLVKHCLHLAADAADATGRRDRDELFAHVYAQERYAERARAEGSPALYRECWDNLEQYAAYLEQLRHDALPRPLPPPTRPPEDEAREGLEQFRESLAAVWKRARAACRSDLEAALRRVAGEGQGLSGRVRADAVAVVRETRRLLGELAAIEERLRDAGPAPAGPAQSGG